MEFCVLGLLGKLKLGSPVSKMARPHQLFTHAILAWVGGLLLAVLPVRAGQDGDYTYSVIDGGVTITHGSLAGDECIIPSTIEGLPVKAIGDGAFYNSWFTHSLTIPEGVTSIGEGAFSYCRSLTNLIVPDSVNHIGYGAFSCCFALPSIKLPNSLTNLENAVFSFCYGLTHISVPDNVVSIGDYAFQNCSALVAVELGSGLQSIGDQAFRDCQALGQLNVPDSVTHVGAEAFSRCGSLTSARLGASLGSIGNNPFAYSCALTNIEVAAANATYVSVEGVLYDKERSILITYPPGKKAAAYTVPAGISVIASNAFHYSSLTQLTLPDSVVEIENHAFEYCQRLRVCNLGTNVVNLGFFAFYYCTNLSHITLSPSLTNLGDYSFAGCQHLEYVVIPRKVNHIGNYAFANCPNLRGLYFLGSPPTIGEDIFHSSYASVIYFLEDNSSWTSVFASRPTQPWKLQFIRGLNQAGVRSNQFGLMVYWKPGQKVVMDACEDMHNPSWSSVATNILTEGSAEFLDPQWVQYPQRFYRLRAW